MGDSGELVAADGVVFDVRDTQKHGDAHGHIGVLKGGSLSVGDEVQAVVDAGRRQAIVLNHSATHLMHAALREVLGDHVAQKGSLVAPDRLRFDFSHFEAVSKEQIRRIEDLVNLHIRRNIGTEAKVMSMDDARAMGAMALFGEKYGDEVRVLRIGGDFSLELCGVCMCSVPVTSACFASSPKVAWPPVCAGLRR